MSMDEWVSICLQVLWYCIALTQTVSVLKDLCKPDTPFFLWKVIRHISGNVTLIPLNLGNRIVKNQYIHEHTDSSSKC